MLESIPCSSFISKRVITNPQSFVARRTLQNVRQFSAPVRCLATPEPARQPPPSEYVPSVKQISDYAARVNRMSVSSTFQAVATPYSAYGATEKLYAECAKQADYTIPNTLKKPPQPAPKNAAGEDIGVGAGAWFAAREQGGFNLPVTFTTWAQLMYLHLYILTVRMRRFPQEHVRIWEQHLMDHFYYAAEDKMEKWHGMAARGVRNKNLKDLWLQWRGAMLSYDEGLIKGDAMLGAAVWRAIFKADVNANISDIALVTAYLRQELQRVDIMTDADLKAGTFEFGNLSTVRTLLRDESVSLTKPFSSEDLAQLETVQAEAERAKR